MLFALRYERDGRSEISSLIQRCQDFGMSLSQLGVVRTILLQAGADKCAPAAGPVCRRPWHVMHATALRWATPTAQHASLNVAWALVSVDAGSIQARTEMHGKPGALHGLLDFLCGP